MNDELDARLGDQLADAAFWRNQVDEGKDWEHHPDGAHDGQLGQDGLAAETRQTFVPHGGQELLAVRVGHKLGTKLNTCLVEYSLGVVGGEREKERKRERERESERERDRDGQSEAERG